MLSQSRDIVDGNFFVLYWRSNFRIDFNCVMISRAQAARIYNIYIQCSMGLLLALCTAIYHVH